MRDAETKLQRYPAPSDVGGRFIAAISAIYRREFTRSRSYHCPGQQKDVTRLLIDVISHRRHTIKNLLREIDPSASGGNSGGFVRASPEGLQTAANPENKRMEEGRRQLSARASGIS
ncbi:hypothetical protein Bbelb_345020 [Branchiostoma belcheri]|nr:hypothetical protein Bbelb_345020 [Branchiostoma belcheri]